MSFGLLPGVKVVSTVPGPMLPIETLRAQCDIVAIDEDSDGVQSHPADAQLLDFLEDAIDQAEAFTGLSIALRTYEMALDGFPWNPEHRGRAAIEIPRPPLVGIDAVLATDAGSDGEMDEGTDFLLDDYRAPARLLPIGTWPAVQRAPGAVKVRFRAGYCTDTYADSNYAGAQPLPGAIRRALLLAVGHFYLNREEASDKALASIPLGFSNLLRPKRVLLGMA